MADTDKQIKIRNIKGNFKGKVQWGNNNARQRDRAWERMLLRFPPRPPRKTCFLCSFWLEVSFNIKREGGKETSFDWCSFSSCFFIIIIFLSWMFPLRTDQYDGNRWLAFVSKNADAHRLSYLMHRSVWENQPGSNRLFPTGSDYRFPLLVKNILHISAKTAVCPLGLTAPPSFPTSGSGMPHQEQQLRFPDVRYS